MAYADYEFYTDVYFGKAIPEDDFERLAERASEKIDALTEYRAEDCLEELGKPVRKAVCAVAEVIQQFESENALIGGSGSRNKSILTEISGQHHVQYAAPMNVIEAEAGKVFERAIVRAASLHLLHTGLMYRGVKRR